MATVWRRVSNPLSAVPNRDLAALISVVWALSASTRAARSALISAIACFKVACGAASAL